MPERRLFFIRAIVWPYKSCAELLCLRFSMLLGLVSGFNIVDVGVHLGWWEAMGKVGSTPDLLWWASVVVSATHLVTKLVLQDSLRFFLAWFWVTASLWSQTEVRSMVIDFSSSVERHQSFIHRDLGTNLLTSESVGTIFGITILLIPFCVRSTPLMISVAQLIRGPLSCFWRENGSLRSMWYLEKCKIPRSLWFFESRSHILSFPISSCRLGQSDCPFECEPLNCLSSCWKLDLKTLLPLIPVCLY